MNFAVPADHRINLKESEKKDKYLDFAKELKTCETWKWRLYQIAVTKELVKGIIDLEIRGWVETIQTTKESWGLEETCYHSNFSERPPAHTYEKNSQGENNANNAEQYDNIFKYE